MKKIRLVTKEDKEAREMREAVKSSFSIAGALRILGLRPAGGNYSVFHRRVKRWNIDTSHFLGHGWNKGSNNGRVGKPIEQHLVQNSTIGSSALRVRLIKEGILEPKCSNCGREIWMGEPIPLELDHINGIHDDSRRKNLRLLCPNCHALTPTYRGKNMSAVAV